MKKSNRIIVQNIPISVTSKEFDDYISLTDMAAAKSEQSKASDVIKNWMRNRMTLEFLGTWEQMYTLSRGV